MARLLVTSQILWLCFCESGQIYKGHIKTLFPGVLQLMHLLELENQLNHIRKYRFQNRAMMSQNGRAKMRQIHYQ